MAAQTKIMTRTFSSPADKVDPSSGEVVRTTVVGEVGDLALGKPGDIWSRAYGPLVYADAFDEDIEYGTFVAGYGVLVNPNDVANMENFEPSTVLKAGQAGAFLVAGAAVVPCSAVEGILENMNGRVICGYTNDDNGICVVEVDGFKESDGSSSGEPPHPPVGPIDDPEDLANAAGVPDATNFGQIQSALNLPDTATPQDAIDAVSG